MITKQCEECNKDFQVKPYRKETARFCSFQCGGAWHQRTRVLRNPNLRGNKHRQGLRPTNAFTSEQVLGENNPRWVESIKLICDFCKNEFELKPWELASRKSKSGLHFCTNKCCKSYRVGPRHPGYRGGPKTYRGRGWLAARKLAVERDKGTCQQCGKIIGDSIPVHHIIPFREFATAEEANRVENLVCYCQSCHMKNEPVLRKDYRIAPQDTSQGDSAPR